MNHILIYHLINIETQIETGRYARNHVDRTQRFCTIFECNDIEDEYHFILICPVYRNIRKNIYKCKIHCKAKYV